MQFSSFIIVNAQSRIKYSLQLIDHNGFISIDKLSSSDTNGVYKTLENIQSKNLEEGYLLSSLDSIHHYPDSVIYYYTKSRQFKGLKISNFDSILRNRNAKSPKLKFISPKQWISFQNRIISYDLNVGYPLSKISLTTDTIIEDTLFAGINYTRGPYFKFGPIDQRNGKLVSDSYLHRILNIKVDYPFCQKEVSRISNVLSQVPFLEVQYAPRVNFFGEEANIYLYLKKKPANNFDFLLGFNKRPAGETKSVRITGQATVDLNNSFKVGERILLHYENLQESSPSLRILTVFPYIKYLPFGIGFNFDLNKFQEEFVNFQTQFKLNKIISQREELSLIFHNNSSYLLSVDSFLIKRENRLRIPFAVGKDHPLRSRLDLPKLCHNLLML